MNRESFTKACKRGALENRISMMHREIEAGEPVWAKEQAIWAAHLGMSVMAMDAGMPEWNVYDAVVRWWNGGNS